MRKLRGSLNKRDRKSARDRKLDFQTVDGRFGS